MTSDYKNSGEAQPPYPQSEHTPLQLTGEQREKLQEIGRMHWRQKVPFLICDEITPPENKDYYESNISSKVRNAIGWAPKHYTEGGKPDYYRLRLDSESAPKFFEENDIWLRPPEQLLLPTAENKSSSPKFTSQDQKFLRGLKIQVDEENKVSEDEMCLAGAVGKDEPVLTYDQIQALREIMAMDWVEGEHYRTTHNTFTWKKMDAYEKRLGWICGQIGWHPQGEIDENENDETPGFRLMTDTQKTTDFLAKHKAQIDGPETDSFIEAPASPGFEELPGKKKKPLSLGLTKEDKALLREYKIGFTRRDQKQFSISLTGEQKEALATIGLREWTQEGENQLVSRSGKMLPQHTVSDLRGILTPEILQAIDLHFEICEPLNVKPSFYHPRITDAQGAIKFFDKNNIPHNMPPIKPTQKIKLTSQDKKFLRALGASPDDCDGPSR